MTKKKVAVALSGGIDSAVTAALLIEEGYDVIGITGKMTCGADSETVVHNAERVADKLGIPHYVVDATKEFEEKIIKYFENSYKMGFTPNPCIMCNKHIKWGQLFDFATEQLNADFIATGHYAKIKNTGGYYKLYPASDEHKDQLYFLFLLDQNHLKKTLFPLSEYTKTQVRELANKYDLPPKSAKESQDICFIKPPMTTKKYLNNLFQPLTGKFVEISSGKILGEHEGYWQYTIGQRKGIGLAAPEALYVIKTEPETNTVYVGYQKDLISESLELKNILWSYQKPQKDFETLVKIRYNMKAVKATVKMRNNSCCVNFDLPVSGITPGQACVFYDINDGHLIGGAFI